MCYYNGQRVTYAEYLVLREIEKDLKKLQLRPQPVITGFDGATSYILVANEARTDFDVIEASWVFVPSNVQGTEDLFVFRSKYDTLNARGEGILESPLYREAALHGRCLVLSTGFYEFRHVHPLGKRGVPLKTPVRYPYRIAVRGREYFYMAGLHNQWFDKEIYETFDTFTIVTTEANSVMEQVHNSKRRMPVILPEDLAYEWLLGNPDESRVRELAAYQLPAEDLDVHPVARDFRTSWNTEPVEYEGLPQISL